jgi:hypothetical protein
MGIGSKELLLIWVLLSAVVGNYSRAKGTGFWFGCILSLALSPLIGVIIVAICRPSAALLEQRALAAGELKKCPACAELIKADATKCKHCSEVLSLA